MSPCFKDIIQENILRVFRKLDLEKMAKRAVILKLEEEMAKRVVDKKGGKQHITRSDLLKKDREIVSSTPSFSRASTSITVEIVNFGASFVCIFFCLARLARFLFLSGNLAV